MGSTNNQSALTPDEIDDVLYFTRVNETADLEQTITELAQKYQTSTSSVLEACADPDNGNTPFHYCAANGHAELFPALLKYAQSSTAHDALNGSSAPTALNRQNNGGSTPLHWAALNGHLAVVKQLVEAGADMWIKNSAGHLAMFEAERNEKNDVVAFLLDAGGKDVERVGAEGAPAADEVDEMDAEEEVVIASASADAAGPSHGQTG